jgi:hypothetical protein
MAGFCGVWVRLEVPVIAALIQGREIESGSAARTEDQGKCQKPMSPKRRMQKIWRSSQLCRQPHPRVGTLAADWESPSGVGVRGICSGAGDVRHEKQELHAPRGQVHSEAQRIDLGDQKAVVPAHANLAGNRPALPLLPLSPRQRGR